LFHTKPIECFAFDQFLKLLFKKYIIFNSLTFSFVYLFHANFKTFILGIKIKNFNGFVYNIFYAKTNSYQTTFLAAFSGV